MPGSVAEISMVRPLRGSRFSLGGGVMLATTRGSLARPLVAIAVWALFLALCVLGATRLEIETSLSSLLDVVSPALTRHITRDPPRRA